MKRQEQTPTPAAPGERLPRTARLYVAGVVGVSLVACGAAVQRDPSFPEPLVLLLWATLGVWAQLAALALPGRRLRLSPSTTVYLAMILCLSPGTIVLPIWISVIAGGWLNGVRAWYRLIFNAAQLSLAAVTAQALLRFLAPASGFDPATAVSWVPAFGAAAVLYYLLNVVLVVGVASAASGRSVRDVFLGSFGYGWELATTGVLCLLAVPAAAGVQAAGLWSVAIAAPLLWGFHRLGATLVGPGGR